MSVTPSEHAKLARYSTLHVGGEARYFTSVGALPDLREALSWAEERTVPWFILGGGANFFCREEGFSGLVIKMENRSLEFSDIREGRGEMTADAGVITRIAVLKAVERGLRGIERIGGIPGTIGGAVRGNAGAFGVETKDHLTLVRALERTAHGWEVHLLRKDQLFFAYRDSTFKREPKRYIIWSATFALPLGDRKEGEKLLAEDVAARKAKQPYEFPSVGSIFKNPSPDRTAGRLIEASGLKGLRIGGAEVSMKHANFIVNRGGASATDIVRLIEEMKKRVRETSGVELEEEIQIL